MQKLTTGQAARALHTSVDTVRRLIDAGELSAERLTDKSQYRIREQDLREFAQRRGIMLLLDAQQTQK
jgi:excisionase family DNA binding protein